MGRSGRDRDSGDRPRGGPARQRGRIDAARSGSASFPKSAGAAENRRRLGSWGAPRERARARPARRRPPRCARPSAPPLRAPRPRARGLVEIAAPALKALSQLSGETINLGVPTPLGVEHLCAGRQPPLSSAAPIGSARRVPYESTANGKVLKAFTFSHARRRRDPQRAATRPPSTSSSTASPRSLHPSSGPDGDAVAALSISGADHSAHPRPPSRSCSRPWLEQGRPRLDATRQPRPARCCMTHEEILKGLYDETLIGNAPEVEGPSSTRAWLRVSVASRCSTTR